MTLGSEDEVRDYLCRKLGNCHFREKANLQRRTVRCTDFTDCEHELRRFELYCTCSSDGHDHFMCMTLRFLVRMHKNLLPVEDF
jgi:hypothetical protein